MLPRFTSNFTQEFIFSNFILFIMMYDLSLEEEKIFPDIQEILLLFFWILNHIWIEDYIWLVQYFYSVCEVILW